MRRLPFSIRDWRFLERRPQPCLDGVPIAAAERQATGITSGASIAGSDQQTRLRTMRCVNIEPMLSPATADRRMTND